MQTLAEGMWSRDKARATEEAGELRTTPLQSGTDPQHTNSLKEAFKTRERLRAQNLRGK